MGKKKTVQAKLDEAKGQWISAGSSPRGRPEPEIPLPSIYRIAPIERSLIDDDGSTRVEVCGAPFVVACVFEAFDEAPSPKVDSSPFERRSMPPAMFHAAWDCQNWMEDGARKVPPALAEALATLCEARISFWVGLGGMIFCESAKDADALETYFL